MTLMQFLMFFGISKLSAIDDSVDNSTQDLFLNCIQSELESETIEKLNPLPANGTMCV